MTSDASEDALLELGEQALLEGEVSCEAVNGGALGELLVEVGGVPDLEVRLVVDESQEDDQQHEGGAGETVEEHAVEMPDHWSDFTSAW